MHIRSGVTNTIISQFIRFIEVGTSFDVSKEIVLDDLVLNDMELRLVDEQMQTVLQQRGVNP